MIPQRGLLNTHHVAAIFGCSAKAVRDLIRNKKLPAYKLNKRAYSIKREDALRYLEECKIDPEKIMGE